MSDGHYILVDKKPVKVDDIREWAKGYEKDRRVAHDELIIDGVEVTVSTVFLGLDHNFDGMGPPILFETMVFGGKHGEFQERYTTWDEAADRHWIVVNEIKAGVFDG